MYEVAEPLLAVLVVGRRLVSGHVEGALAQEGLRVGRHVGEIVHDHEHLDHSAQGVEESQLNGSFLWHSVSLLAEVDMALEIELIASPGTNCGDQLTK